jgi:hypothetical protein
MSAAGGLPAGGQLVGLGKMETGPSPTHSGTVGLTLSPMPEAETSTRLWASTCSESGLVHYRRAACTKANFQAHTKNWKSKNDHQPSQG